jgi:hypothetical protein
MWIELSDDSAYWRGWLGGVKASLCQQPNVSYYIVIILDLFLIKFAFHVSSEVLRMIFAEILS